MVASTGPAWALDDGKPGPGELWAPGQIIVRFKDGVGAAERERIANAAGVTIEHELPLVRDLFEVQTEGKVRDAEVRLDKERDIEYSQPDYISQEQPDDAPTAAGYWPNDPYFWPYKLTADVNCPTPPDEEASFQHQLGGWGLWPTEQNLTDPEAQPVKDNIDPIAVDRRPDEPGGQVAYGSYWGIDVLPVWNLLLDAGKLWNGQEGDASRGNPLVRQPQWQAVQIDEYGVGVIDSGISSNPQIRDQVAELYSVGTSSDESRRGVFGQRRQRVRLVYADDQDRGKTDVEHIRNVLVPKQTGLVVEPALRSLLLLDDTGAALDSKHPYMAVNRQGQRVLPFGCDGHGTAVTSILGARANDNKGIAGVGYDVPAVGIRVAEPWDAPNSQLAYARSIWPGWSERAETTDSDWIAMYAVVKALQLPVVNMSYGHGMFVPGQDSAGHGVAVVKHPSRLEAEAKLFTYGKTLGIVSAGNNEQSYGAGPSATGRRLYGKEVPGENPNENKLLAGIPEPCGLPLINKFGVWQAPVGADPNQYPVAAEKRFTIPGVDWSKLNLICVAATSSFNSALTSWSGRGPSAVQLAAPGASITVAARPSWELPNLPMYRNGSGTSYSAPMVSGAASLLRRAAPGAEMGEIRVALEQGSRMTLDLVGKVQSGQLDVACSLRWMLAHRQEKWHLIDLAKVKQTDPAGYQDFLDHTDRCGRNARRPIWEAGTVTVEKSLVLAPARRYDTVQDFIDKLELQPGPDSSSIRWQDYFTGGGARFADTRAVFRIPGGNSPIAPPARPVYAMGFVTVGCPQLGYRITGLELSFDNVIKPSSAYAIPTDADGPFKKIELAVAVAKPWYHGLLGNRIQVRASVRCQGG